jgi:hypothetical protein
MGATLLDYLSEDYTLATVRSVALQSDPTKFPYRAAQISFREYDPNVLFPTAFYVLEENLARTELLYRTLLSEGVDILHLKGMLRYEFEGREHIIAPPLVEHYVERVGPSQGSVDVVVDGLHRVFLARSLRVSVIAVTVAGATEPLVPLPVGWEEVRTVIEMPSSDSKRRYRYPDYLVFPSDEVPNGENFTLEQKRYYYYRDLGPIGSEGIRKGT